MRYKHKLKEAQGGFLIFFLLILELQAYKAKIKGAKTFENMLTAVETKDSGETPKISLIQVE